jgi:hypothetical protein
MDSFTQDSHGFMITGSDMLVDCESNFELFASHHANMSFSNNDPDNRNKILRVCWNAYLRQRNDPWYESLKFWNTCNIFC